MDENYINSVRETLGLCVTQKPSKSNESLLQNLKNRKKLKSKLQVNKSQKTVILENTERNIKDSCLEFDIEQLNNTEILTNQENRKKSSIKLKKNIKTMKDPNPITVPTKQEVKNRKPCNTNCDISPNFKAISPSQFSNEPLRTKKKKNEDFDFSPNLNVNPTQDLNEPLLTETIFPSVSNKPAALNVTKKLNISKLKNKINTDNDSSENGSKDNKIKSNRKKKTQSSISDTITYELPNSLNNLFSKYDLKPDQHDPRETILPRSKNIHFAKQFSTKIKKSSEKNKDKITSKRKIESDVTCISKKPVVTFEDLSSKYDLDTPHYQIGYTNIKDSFKFLSLNADKISDDERVTTKKLKQRNTKKSSKIAKENNQNKKMLYAGFERDHVSKKLVPKNIENTSWEVEECDTLITPEMPVDIPQISIDTPEEKVNTVDHTTEIPVDTPEIPFKESYLKQKHFIQLQDFNDGTTYLVLKPNATLHFHGSISFKIVHGELEVLGTVLSKSSQAQTIHSPRGSALMYLKNINSELSDREINLQSLGIHHLTFKNLNENSVVLKYHSFQDPVMNFIVKYTSQMLLPDTKKVHFEPEGNFSKLRADNAAWDLPIERLGNGKKLMVVGGKGVGKSTYLRYAINKLLTKFPKIRLLDLDPGQAEFTVPGCISIVTIMNPVFGPNYTHLQDADRSILSSIDVATDIKKYINSVYQLSTELNQMESIPTLINFMGFTQDMGFDILSSCIAICQPDFVLNILSKSANKNYKIPVNIGNVKAHYNNFYDAQLQCFKDFETLELHSTAESNDAWSLEARQARELCVLAYFGKMMTSNINSLSSSDLKMFSIKLSSIEVMDIEGNIISPLAANANLVALCSMIDKNTGVFDCYGYGIVRGIDVNMDVLVLLTPLDGSELDKVYHLVVASVTLPPSVLMTIDDVVGHVPYVNKGEVVGLGQLTKRSYLPKK